MPGYLYLSTRVKEPTKGDWFKLTQMLGFLKATQEDVITLESDRSHIITWYPDTAPAVQNDCNGHTGAVMSI